MRYLGVIGGFIVVLFLTNIVSGQGLGAGPYIERGAYYLEQGMVSRAIEQLQKAIELEPENTDALLYLATALRVSGRHSEARQYISKAMSLQPEEPLILLEAVLLEIETKNYTEAEKLLNKVLSTATDPEVISDAKEYLEILRTQRPKHYGLSISGGAFYDTNVILEPEGINTGEEKDDWATAGNLSAWYGLWPQGPITIYGQYNLFQSIYFNEKDYNLQEHTLSFAIQRPAKVFIPALLYDFKYQSLGGDKYGLYHILTASATVQETAHLKTDVLYSHTFRDMYDTTVSPSNSDRSGGVDTIKIIQSYRWGPERSVSVGLVYEIEDSDKPWWDRKSLGFIAEGSYDITKTFTLYAEISYYDRTSDDTNPYIGIKREDKIQQYLLSINWKVMKKTALMLYGIYQKNSSNSSLLDYSRTIGGVKVTVEVL